MRARILSESVAAWAGGVSAEGERVSQTSLMTSGPLKNRLASVMRLHSELSLLCDIMCSM